MSMEQEWAIDDGVTVSGRKGLFTPADAYRLDKLWSKKGAISPASGGDVDWSFVGDVEGMTLTDASGTKVANLTVKELETVKEKLSSVESQLSGLNAEVTNTQQSISRLSEQLSEMSSSMDNSAMMAAYESMQTRIEELQTSASEMRAITESCKELKEATLHLEAELMNVTENQRNYLRYADYSTVDGSMVLIDGYGVETFTLGAATFDTVGAAEPSNPDD